MIMIDDDINIWKVKGKFRCETGDNENCGECVKNPLPNIFAITFKF